jgi:phosphate acetyltransferase
MFIFMDFMEKIVQRAKSDKKTIVLPEGNDKRVLTAAAEILKQGIANVILLGKESQIKSLAGSLDLSGAKIIDPENTPLHGGYAKTFYELRKAKGVTPEKADEMMKDPTYFGVMMVKKEDADGMVSGACHSTANTLRPALQIVRTAPDCKLVSGFFLVSVPNCEYGEHGTFLFSDCALNINPNPDELSEIAIASAKSFKTIIGAEPKVAMLSFSTHGSGKDALVDKVAEATKIARQKAPDLQLDGELQADAALVPSVGEFKAPGSKVAGRANVLIFPDLNVGNICYKLVERLAKASTYGVILQGIAKPINDMSRGCSAKDIVGVVAITAVEAQTNSVH